MKILNANKEDQLLCRLKILLELFDISIQSFEQNSQSNVPSFTIDIIDKTHFLSI